MNSKTKRNFILTGIMLFAFVLFTVMVSAVDVEAIGPENSKVGMASVNQFVYDLFGTSSVWYKITEFLGVVSVMVAASFAAFGAVQLIKRKSILKIDPDILCLGGFYILVAAAYLFFEVFIINYRPVILDGNLEASYPSSHTVLSVCIMVTAAMQFRKRIKNRKIMAVSVAAAWIITVATVIGRLVSGVHWFTDIIGGLILSAALIMLYYSFTLLTEKKSRSNYMII